MDTAIGSKKIIGMALCAEYLLRPFEPKFTNINLHFLHYELFEKEGEFKQ